MSTTEPRPAEGDLRPIAGEASLVTGGHRPPSPSMPGLHALVDALPQLVWRADVDGRLVEVNRPYVAYTGLTDVEVHGMPLDAVVHPEDRAHDRMRFNEGARSSGEIEVEHRLRRADGAYRWFLCRARALRGAHDVILGWVGTCTDVDALHRRAEERDRMLAEARSARQAAEESEAKLRAFGDAMRQSEERLRMAVEAAAVGTWDYDARTRAIVCNARCKAMVGLPASADLTEDTFRAALHPGDWQDALRSVLAALGRADGDCNVEVRTSGLIDGAVRWVRLVGRVCRDIDGVPIRFVGTAVDVTGERTARDEQARQDRWRDLLLAVLGHDLRGPLSAIRLSADLLMRSGPAPKTASHIRRIQIAGDRMTVMIRQLLDMTRLRLDGELKLEARDVDVGVLCKQAIDEVGAAYPAAVFDLDISGDVRTVCDPDRLFQVLANLAQNAVAHGRGPVSIRLHGADDHLELDVHNHGAPIPASLLPALFEPFVRGVGGSAAGLGLGLFITRKIVEGHGGTIGVRSTDIGGTTFAIRLPRRR